MFSNNNERSRRKERRNLSAETIGKTMSWGDLMAVKALKRVVLYLVTPNHSVEKNIFPE